MKTAIADKKMKLIGLITLLVAFILGFAPSLSITSLTISDSDPNTYIAVVMLMLPIFMLFSFKERLEFRFKTKNALLGALIFAVYVIILSYLRVSSSYLFVLYRPWSILLPEAHICL